MHARARAPASRAAGGGARRDDRGREAGRLDRRERRRLDPVRRAAGARAVRDAVARPPRAQQQPARIRRHVGPDVDRRVHRRAGSTDVDGRGEVWTMRGGTDSAEWYVAALERALDVLPAEVFPAGLRPARCDRAGARTRPSRSCRRSRSPRGDASRSDDSANERPGRIRRGDDGELVRARAGDARIGLRFEDSSWTWAEIVDAAAQRAAFFRGQRAGRRAVPRRRAARQHARVLVHALREPRSPARRSSASTRRGAAPSWRATSRTPTARSC